MTYRKFISTVKESWKRVKQESEIDSEIYYLQANDIRCTFWIMGSQEKDLANLS